MVLRGERLQCRLGPSYCGQSVRPSFPGAHTSAVHPRARLDTASKLRLAARRMPRTGHPRPRSVASRTGFSGWHSTRSVAATLGWESCQATKFLGMDQRWVAARTGSCEVHHAQALMAMRIGVHFMSHVHHVTAAGRGLRGSLTLKSVRLSFSKRTSTSP